jgi:uncharacterized protein YxeA
MMKFCIVWLAMLLVTVGIGHSAYAHDMTPTYPKFTHSHLDGIVKTTLSIFNKRQDVQYYEIKVFDKNFNPIPFVTSHNVIKLDYLSTANFDIYIRRNDVSRAIYICSLSKLKRDDSVRTAVSSRICSKIKNE